MYFVDKVDWPSFYEKLVKITNVWDEIKANDQVLKPIVNKWVKRSKEVTFLCFSMISSSNLHIEKNYDIVHDLSNFDDRRVELQRRIVNYLEKYKSVKFDLFPHAIDRKNRLKNKEEWTQELNDLFCLRMNRVINEKGNAWWETTTEEIVKVQLFFDSLRWDFSEIEKIVEYVIKKHQDILQFDWLDDTLFDKWMIDIAHGEQLEELKIDNDEMEQDEVQIIDTSSRDQRE